MSERAEPVLPAFDMAGNLPPGEHPCGWSEFEKRFGWNRRRRELLRGMLSALQNLRDAGASEVWLDGSFVTEKELPGDWDGCYTPTGVDPSRLDAIFRDPIDLQVGRPRQKAKFGGEMLFAVSPGGPHGTILDLFKTDKQTGSAKGIVSI